MATNDLLDRYLYAVRRYLPAYHQDDLVAELSANLHSEMDDKQAELGRPLTEDEQVDVVRRHGHPILVAARYQPQRWLIGPEVFPFYWFTIRRVLPWVVGIWLLVTAATLIFGAQSTPIAHRIDAGQIITGLFGAIFQFVAWITVGFALLEYFKGHLSREFTHPHWDPRKLPQVDLVADQKGPHHPWADAIAGAVFLAWLLAFPRFPVLMFGPYVSWHLLNMDLPEVWHQFYWLVVAFNCIQLTARIALLFRSVRRHYPIIETVIHLLGIGIIASLLRVHDYIGQATFGGSPMSPQTVATVNLSIHRGLLLVLILALGQLLWDTARRLRTKAASQIPART
ncbi:MAG: hypothetical protein WCB58_22015 [Acidobacteriaceae bacterium]